MSVLVEEAFVIERFSDGKITLVRPVVVLVEFFKIIFELHKSSSLRHCAKRLLHIERNFQIRAASACVQYGGCEGVFVGHRSPRKFILTCTMSV